MVTMTFLSDLVLSECVGPKAMGVQSLGISTFLRKLQTMFSGTFLLKKAMSIPGNKSNSHILNPVSTSSESCTLANI